MLSNASKYAIRAVLFLAANSTVDNKYSAVQIAEELEIPLHFIAKLLQKLAKTGIISSMKGPRGGFYLTDINQKNNICSVLNEIESERIFEHCFMGLHTCNAENPCPVHHIVAPFKANLLAKFEQQTIAEFAEEMSKDGSVLSLKGK